jgi:hypothetical protein
MWKMEIAQQKPRRRHASSAFAVRIEPVDNWHARWTDVLAHVAAAGELTSLSIDAEGWLSARQVLLAAFSRSDDSVVGHICFRLVPVARPRGKVAVEALLDSFDCAPLAQSSKVRAALRAAALRRAKSLRCTKFNGLKA